MSVSVRSWRVVVVLVLGIAQAATAQRVVELSSLAPGAGFRMDGLADGDLLGINADGIGDFNGDGLDDFLVSAEEAQAGRGSTYVVFGRATGFPSGLSLSRLNGTNGFRLDGAEYEGFNHRARGAGDVNGDGRADLILGLSSSHGFDGRACIVYGQATMPATTTIDALPAGRATCMDGAQDAENIGKSVTALGDFNGDGLDDVAIGTAHGDHAGPESGSVYVVFGRAPTLGSHIALEALEGTSGFRIDGASAGDRFGISVAAGDINGDDRADLIAGAEGAGPDGRSQGAAYVLFGTDQRQATPLSATALDGARGFALRSGVDFHFIGRAVGAADINGDGCDDVLVGTLQNHAFVLHGRTSAFPAAVDLQALDGANGFRIFGSLPGDRVGESLAGIGDLNGDGIDDIALGAQFADPNGASSGAVHVVFGSTAPRTSVLLLGTLPDVTGVSFHGTASEDYCGLNITLAGDLNRDGGADLLLSCHGASTLGPYRGAVYAIYGEVAGPIFENGME
jgi:hypothetical protein